MIAPLCGYTYDALRDSSASGCDIDLLAHEVGDGGGYAPP